MAGKGLAVKSGKELQQKVVELAHALGLNAKTEVKAARRIWGAERYIDVIVSNTSNTKTLGIECKYQGTSGSAEEKIPSTIEDIQSWPIAGLVVINGDGFSTNMVGYLLSTGKVVWFKDLEDWLRLYFSLV